MYHVLRTVDNDGKLLTDLPTHERIFLNTEDHTEAVTEAMRMRTSLYRHRKTGETRLFSELDLTSGVYRENDDVSNWRFLKASEMLGYRGYALVVEDKDLPLYEPKA
jgi:hypothetical protein